VPQRDRGLYDEELEAITQVAGKLAHDFNNLLMAILGAAELAVCEIPDDSPAQEDLGTIIEAAKEARDLTTQLLTFAQHPTSNEASARADSVNAEASGAETIMVVDDKATVRRIARRILAKHGYTVIEARDGAEALHLVARATRPIDLVVSDVMMPMMGGRELAARLAQVHPECAILLVSGYAGSEALADGIAFLQKPFTAEALVATVRATLDARG